MQRTFWSFVCGAVIGGTGIGLAQRGHDHGAGPAVKPLAAYDITEPLAGAPAKAAFLEVTFEPGAAGTPHRHPGPVFGYVLEGEFETQVGDGPVQKLTAGQTFYEPTMALHAVSRNGGKSRARVLAVMLHPRDAKELVIPEPPRSD